MSEAPRTVFRNNGRGTETDCMPQEARPAPVSDDVFHDQVVLALARIAARHGRPELAKAMGRDMRSLEYVFAGTTPKPKALFDVLLLDPTVLDEVLALYGLHAGPKWAARQIDMKLAAGLSQGLTALLNSLADGTLTHVEILQLADLFRPHMGQIQAIIDQADELRSPTR